MVVRFTSLNLDAWTGDGWFFDPFAWQFLFIIGVMLACAPMRRPSRPWLLDAVAASVVVLGVVVTLVIEPYPHLLDWVSGSAVLHYLVVEDKTGLYPFRLLSILSLTWLCVRLIRFDQPWLRSRWAAPFVLLGQNSLPVFCSGIVFGFLARLGLEYDDRTFMQVANQPVRRDRHDRRRRAGGLVPDEGAATSPRSVPSACRHRPLHSCGWMLSLIPVEAMKWHSVSPAFR